MGSIKLAVVECDSGRLQNSLQILNEVAEIVAAVGPWVTGRYHLELATTLKDLGVAESRAIFFDRAFEHYQQALYEFEAIGNHRLTAIVENNYGYFLLAIRRFDEAKSHLIRARVLFDGFADKTRVAQVDETLARLYLANDRLDLAEEAVRRAVQRLQQGGEEALLAEALSTQGLILCRLGRQSEAKRVLERGSRVAESCGDYERAGICLLILIEEMIQKLDDDERVEIGSRLEQLLAPSQKASIVKRILKCRDIIAGSVTHKAEPPRIPCVE